MVIDAPSPIDVRDVDPVVDPFGAAVYVDLGDPDRLPRLRFTDALDAVKVADACARAALSLRAGELATRWTEQAARARG